MAVTPQINQVNPQPKRAQGSGFTNLSRILQANKGNRLGDAIKSGITGGAEQVRQQLGDTRNEFQQKSDAANLASDSNKLIRENVLRNIAGGQTDLNQDQLNQFTKFREGNYTGPMELDPGRVASLTGRAQELKTQARNPLSENTLQATVGVQSNQPYTRGQIGLDRTLLGTINPQVLNQTRSQVRGLPQNVVAEQNAARGIGNLRQQEAVQFGKDTSSIIGAQTGGLQQDIQNRVANLSQAQQDAYNKYQQALQSGQIGGIDELSYLKGQSKFGLNPLNYLSKTETPISAATTANSQQKAQLDALAKLSGQDQTFLPSLAQQAYDPNKPVSFNKDLFFQDLGNQQRAYNTAIKNTQVSTPQANAEGYSYAPQSLADAIPRLQELKAAYAQERARGIPAQYSTYLKPIQDIEQALSNLQNQFGYNEKFY